MGMFRKVWLLVFGLTSLPLVGDPRFWLESDDEYLARIWPITMVVDPDWYPYEALDQNGQHVGIAAELVRLIAQRAGVGIPVLKTATWEESLEAARSGRAKLVSFLNQSPERSEWLLFTDPYFSDPNVFITREEHDYISDPARLVNETVALPVGTSIEERLRKDYPNLRIELVASEREAMQFVSDRRADLTLRSLTMAAYTIKNEGLFNLKIAGQINSFTNQFRIGVVKSEPRLRDILNRGVAQITPQDVQTAVSHHIAIRINREVDYTWAAWIGATTVILLTLGLLWILQLRRLNAALAQRDAEKAIILKEVHHRIKNNMNTIQGLLFLQAESMPDSAAAAALEDAQNRVQSMMVLYDKIYRSEAYGPVRACDYLSDLVDRILENFPAVPTVHVHKRLGDFTLSPGQIQPLGIILNELLTNIMKYAFRGRLEGTIDIAASVAGPTVTLSVEDDGPGMPAGVNFETSKGFGLQLVALLTRQLEGEIRVERERGTRVVVAFPAAGP